MIATREKHHGDKAECFLNFKSPRIRRPIVTDSFEVADRSYGLQMKVGGGKECLQHG